MLKKALLTGVFGLVLTSGMAFGSVCPGDVCKVEDPTKVEFGLNLRIDVDVCVDAGNLMNDYWSTQAVVYQDGDGNAALITQNNISQTAGIVQVGDENFGEITQSAANEYAFIYQGGNSNVADISQTLSSAAAIVVQLGNGNFASISQ